MASYHLSVKTVQRSAGRSATAAAVYRHAARIACDREGRVHDYRAKAGVEHSFIVAPDDAPAWAQDRQALWNAAEARETRVNSVTAREWELALPHELDGAGRRALAEGFARELVERYGVAADVAIHAPHREGDGRNHHAHVLTTTRTLGREGLGDKTRALDAKQTGGPEIAHMRERWATLQNHALALRGHGVEAWVDHRSLAVQRDEARSLGHEARADNLDRAPEAKLGPVVGGIERREERAAEREERAYVPLTERGAQVHEARAARGLMAELARARDALREEVRERAELARETYVHAREEGTDRVRAGLAALRAAAHRQGIGHEASGHERAASHEAIRERLGSVLGRAQETGHGQGRDPSQQEREANRASIRERLDALRERARPGAEREGTAAGLPAREQGREQARSREAAHGAQEPNPINAQLRALLARERTAAERHGPVARLLERVRDEPGWAPSFRTPHEAQAFREEMGRRFDGATLQRLGRGEERALAEVAGDRLDGLRMAKAWLDSGGEPERSERRMSLARKIGDAQIDARREQDGHGWGL